jgi:hypothetical protein
MHSSLIAKLSCRAVTYRHPFVYNSSTHQNPDTMSAPPLVLGDAAEKGNGYPTNDAEAQTNHTSNEPSGNFFTHINTRITRIAFLEARGIQRVPSDSRYPPSRLGYLQMSLLWFSINLTANNIALGFLGPLVYDLGFTDSALCAVFGGLLGSAGAAYMSTWGPRSGNRTMVVARYFMAYYPSKLASALNVIIMLGYGLIDCLIGGRYSRLFRVVAEVSWSVSSSLR